MSIVPNVSYHDGLVIEELGDGGEVGIGIGRGIGIGIGMAMAMASVRMVSCHVRLHAYPYMW